MVRQVHHREVHKVIKVLLREVTKGQPIQVRRDLKGTVTLVQQDRQVTMVLQDLKVLKGLRGTRDM